MQISFDPPKRDKTLLERGLDFAAAAEVFAGRTFDQVDDRHDYGEVRIITIGFVGGRMWSWCGPSADRHATSFR